MDIKDISVGTRMIETTPPLKQTLVFSTRIVLDLAFSAAAGAAAAVVGAHYNGLAQNSIPYPEIVTLGSLAGAVMGGTLSLRGVAQKAAGQDQVKLIWLAIIFNPAILCALVTAGVCWQALDGHLPPALLVASIIASLPFTLEFCGVDSLNGLLRRRVGLFWLIGMDTLAGVLFARIARHHGYEVCGLGAAAAAGAAYGSVSAIRIQVNMLIEASNVRTNTDSEGQYEHVRSLVGNWEVDDPLPVNKKALQL